MIKVPEEYHTGRVVASRIKIIQAAHRLAERIARNYKNKKTPILLCVDEGAREFMGILAIQLYELRFDFDQAHITAKSYRGDQSSGTVKIEGYSGPDLEGRFVIIVEDIIDTSLSMRELVSYLKKSHIADYEICVMLFKKRPDNFVWRLFGLREVFGYPRVRYVGILISNLFVVGCGLDYRDCLRSLSDVSVISPEEKRYIDRAMGGEA